MKQSQKLDLILKKLFEYRDQGYKQIISVMKEIGMYESPEEAERIARRLHEDGYVKAIFTSGARAEVKISSHGIDYCEESSYSKPGISLITLNISGDNNQTVVAGRDASNISQSQYINKDVERLIGEIKNALTKTTELTLDKKEATLDCIEDIESDIKVGKKVKKFKWDSLLTNTASSAQIVSLATQLAQVFGYLPSL